MQADGIPSPDAVLNDPTYRILRIDKLVARLEHDFPNEVTRPYERELRALWKASPLQQITKRPVQFKPYSKIHFLKSAAPPGSWQIDVVDLTTLTTSHSRQHLLMLIEIPSRFIWARPIQANTSAVPMSRTLKIYAKFAEQEFHTLVAIYGDDYFNNIAFRAYNDVLQVAVLTNVADDDHITKGDFLGIIDIAVRNLRDLLSKAQALAPSGSNDWHDLLQTVIATYNTNPHTALSGKTPQEVHDNTELCENMYKKALEFNKALKEKHSDFFDRFKQGDVVRILKKYWKDTDKKRRLVKFSIELFVVVRKDGNKWRIRHQGDPDTEASTLKRRFKTGELQLVHGSGTIDDPDQVSNVVERHTQIVADDKRRRSEALQRRRAARNARDADADADADSARAPSVSSDPPPTPPHQQRSVIQKVLEQHAKGARLHAIADTLRATGIDLNVREIGTIVKDHEEEERDRAVAKRAHPHMGKHGTVPLETVSKKINVNMHALQRALQRFPRPAQGNFEAEHINELCAKAVTAKEAFPDLLQTVLRDFPDYSPSDLFKTFTTSKGYKAPGGEIRRHTQKELTASVKDLAEVGYTLPDLLRALGKVRAGKLSANDSTSFILKLYEHHTAGKR